METITPRITDAPAAHDEAERRIARLEALRRIHRAAMQTLDLAPLLDGVAAAVAGVLGCDACAVYLTDEERGALVLAATHGVPDGAVGQVRLRLGEGGIGEAAARHVIVVADTAGQPGGFGARIAVPLDVRTKQRSVGVLVLFYREAHPVDAEERSFLEAVADELAVAIDHALRYQAKDAELQRKVAELQTLQRVTAVVTSTLDLKRVLETIAEQAAMLGQADVVSMYELGHDGETLTFLAGYEAGGVGPNVREEVRREAVRRAMRASQSDNSGEPIFMADARDADGAESVFCIPLRTAHGTIGGICLHFDAGNAPSREQIDLMQSFCNTAAIAIEQARLYDDARRALSSTSALLQEMHHRVRNNLQTVAALLSMHVRRAGDEAWAPPLKEAVNRIRSIAAVHDLLTREDIGITTVNEVAKLVTDEAAMTLVPPGATYLFRVQGEPAEVSSREATVLAILINELVANAVLHGLQGQRAGTVAVGIGNAQGQVTVRVEDSGRGFPPGFRADVDGGLGLQITQNLVTTDLRGTVSLETSPLGGGAVVITFAPRPGNPFPAASAVIGEGTA
jgi:two-component sensor histidine kinase/putative methionine-R-sulfoxide reductase with GAF domain